MMRDEKLDGMARREWLETNGLGSYASGTSCGAGTRRYHGLLVAALDPPVRRHVLLSRIEETLTVDGAEYPLSTNFYRGTVHPEGYRNLTSFEARPVATWTFSAGGVEVERRVWMPHGRQGVAVTYAMRGAKRGVKARLSARPLVAFRDFHALRAEGDVDARVEAEPGVVAIRPYRELPELFVHHNADEFVREPLWYRGFEYAIELERGFEGHEDLFSHGRFDFNLADGGTAFVYAALERVEGLGVAEIRSLESREIARRGDWSARAARSRSTPRPTADQLSRRVVPALDRWADTFATRLAEAAEQFLVARADGRRTIVAGYHWFADWGRDTFISLPGLSLATGRWPLAYEILRTFAAHVDHGMVPNRFPEQGAAPEYNSVDAALWFVEASRRYVHDTGDLDFAGRELMPRVAEVLDWYSRGTRYGIAVDPRDGLLAAGSEGVALTWMDAVVDGRPVTPRRGKPVEVNGLWYNALLAAAEMAEALWQGDRSKCWRAEAARVRASFNQRFWCEERGWLYDVIDGPEGDDASLRPNQLLAMSLHNDVLDEARRPAVVAAVESRLLTPLGVRTLDPEHPAYKGTCVGGPAERDAAYHNGTVWPWLLGPFAGAYLRAHGRTPAARERVRATVEPLSRHLGTEGCLGQISEIADGDPPHTSRGCVAQAWSVAEVARVLLEELR